MSQMEIDRVLSQIRSMSQTVRSGAVGGIGGAGAGGNAVAGVDNGFAKLLKQGIDSVNQTQSRATDRSRPSSSAECRASSCRR
jgi:flagellar hook-basal body complex protein FliE